MSKLWPSGRLKVTEGLGHQGALRQPEIVEEIVSFIASSQDRDL